MLLRIVRVLLAFGATAKHSRELQPPAGPMPRRRTLLSGRRCPLSRQTSTRVGHMLFRFLFVKKGCRNQRTAGPKDFDGFVYKLVAPLPPIDSSKFFFVTIVYQGGGVDRY